MNAPIPPRFWTGPRVFAIAAASAVVGVFVAANVHLVAVSFSSRPDCVPHLKSPTEGVALYRAAKPSC